MYYKYQKNQIINLRLFQLYNPIMKRKYHNKMSKFFSGVEIELFYRDRFLSKQIFFGNMFHYKLKLNMIFFPVLVNGCGPANM